MKRYLQYALATSLLATATYGYGMFKALGDTDSQLNVKRDYTICHFDKDINADSASYHFGAYAYNNSATAYGGKVTLEVDGVKGTAAHDADIVVEPGDSAYICIDFAVKRGERVTIGVLDCNGESISDKLAIDVPSDKMTRPQYESTIVKTFQTLDENYNIVPYDGDSISCGIEDVAYILKANNAKSFIWPYAGYMEINMGDVYGIYNYRGFIDLADDFDACEGSEVAFSVIDEKFTLLRGGVYDYSETMPCVNHYQTRRFNIYDIPTLRLDFTSEVTTGKDIDFKAGYNTGYPYSDEVKTRAYNSNIVVDYLKPHAGQEMDTIAKFMTLAHTTLFDVANYPLIAGVDTFPLLMEKPELGEYLIDFRSEYRNGECDRLCSVSVCDTLRYTLELDKNTFVKDVDTKATLHYKLDKKWPYITNHMGDSIPSVHIVPSCICNVNWMTKADSLFCDSLFNQKTHADSLVAQARLDSLVGTFDVIADSLLIPIGVNMPLDVEGDFTFDVGKCTPGDSLTLYVDVKNIDEKAVAQKFTIFIQDSTPSGIVDVVRDNECAPRRRGTFNLLGQPVGDGYRGIVIKDGKKVLRR